MILGLSGKKGSGKDTTYKYIEEWFQENDDLSVRRDAFADRLKLSAARCFVPTISLQDAVTLCDEIKINGDLSLVFGEGDEWCEINVTGRELLQRYGTEAHRDVFGNHFWLKPIIEAYEDSDEDLTVVTDVRFPNEAEMIRRLGGEIWQIDRPTDDSDLHASEVPLSSTLVDQVIPNTGDLKDLSAQVWMQLEELLELGVL